MKMLLLILFACALLAVAPTAQSRNAFGSIVAGLAQAPAQRPGPTVTVRGHTFTQLSLFQRNVGGPGT